MRLSVLKDDPGYSPLAVGGAIPYLEGKQVRLVQTADEEEGYVDRIVEDETGHPLVKNGDIVTERLYGEVKIKMRKK